MIVLLTHSPEAYLMNRVGCKANRSIVVTPIQKYEKDYQHYGREMPLTGFPEWH
jgi:hypothetical protein